MCFFFSCTPWHKPNHYLNGACNEFGFGLIIKSKVQLSNSDKSNDSSTSVFISAIFQKYPKMLLLRVFKPLFLESLTKCLRKHLESSYLHKKSTNFAGLCIWLLQLLASPNTYVVYVNFRHEWLRTTVFKKVFLAILFHSQSFCQKLAERKLPNKKIFHVTFYS